MFCCLGDDDVDSFAHQFIAVSSDKYLVIRFCVADKGDFIVCHFRNQDAVALAFSSFKRQIAKSTRIIPCLFDLSTVVNCSWTSKKQKCPRRCTCKKHKKRISWENAYLSNSCPCFSPFWRRHFSNNIYLLKTVDNFFVRSLMIWRGICSHFAAGVPGRGKNWFMNKLGNLYFSQSDIVSSKSSSVSVGKPAMISSRIYFPSLQ